MVGRVWWEDLVGAGEICPKNIHFLKIALIGHFTHAYLSNCVGSPESS